MQQSIVCKQLDFSNFIYRLQLVYILSARIQIAFAQSKSAFLMIDIKRLKTYFFY